MGKFLAIVLALVLAGCTTTEYVYKTVEVEVPIVEPCIKEIPVISEYAYMQIIPETTFEETVDLARQALIQHRATEQELLLLMKPCINEQKEGAL